MRLTLTLLLCGLSYNLFSQVGINTDAPEALLHIDGKTNVTNSLLKITEDVNNTSKTRFVVLQNGNIGINEANPTNKLVIANDAFDEPNNRRNTGLQLKNGAKIGAKLVSDSEGNAYWDNNSFVAGVMPQNGVNVLNFNEYVNTNTKIVLPTGNWQISLGIYGEVGNYNVNNLTSLGAVANIIETNNSIECSAVLKVKNIRQNQDGSVDTIYEDMPDSFHYIPSSNRSIIGAVGRSMNRLLIDGSFLLKLSEPKELNVFVKCDKLGSGDLNKRIGNLFGPVGSSIGGQPYTNSWFYATSF